MAIFTQSPFIQSVLLAGVISLAGCGGGGSKTPAPTPDTTPNAYSYTATTNAELSAVVTSAAVTISGIDTAAPVTITGGEYSIAGGAFTSAAGTVTNGQTITIRVTAPAVNSTSASAQLTVGGVAATFTVTTKADSIPNTFAFTAQTNAALNTEYTSNTITLGGIDTAVPISITGGTYSINGGAFTSAAGTVSVNNTIAVKGTSTSARESTHNVVLTIGGVSATYSITTIADTTPPVAEFKFPTPYTMSEANTVKVRGTATDDNVISNVKVVVRSFKLDTPTETLATTEINATPKAEANGVKDFSSWTVDIPLTALAENEIKVIATDDRNNAIQLSDANKVVIRQADVKSAFPDEDNQFDSIVYGSAINVGGDHERLLVAASGKILAVDLNTGLRSVFSDHTSSCGGYLFGLLTDNVDRRVYGYCNDRPLGLVELNIDDGSFVAKYTSEFITKNVFGIALDRNNARNQLVLVEQSWWRQSPSLGGNLVLFSIDTKNYSILYKADQDPIIQDAERVIVDGDRYLITVGGQNEDILKHQVVSVDALTGRHAVVTSNAIGSGESFNALLPNGDVDVLKGIALAKKQNVLFLNEMVSGRLLAVDLSTNTRAIFKNLAYENTDEPNTLVYEIDINESEDYLVLSEAGRQSILIVDALTGEKVILSKSVNDF